MNDCIKIQNFYVLRYFIEPKKEVFYLYEDHNGLRCVTNINLAFTFSSRESALNKAELFNSVFGINFDVIGV